MKTRPCVFTSFVSGSSREVHARFHGFSMCYDEYETGPGNYAVAIVELEDGSVEIVVADLIRFTDV